MLSSDDDFGSFESLESLRMDLEELKARGNQLRLEHRRELQNLKSEFEPLLETLHAKHAHPDSSIYHQIMEPAKKQKSPSLSFSSFENGGGVVAADYEEKKDEDGFEDISDGFEDISDGFEDISQEYAEEVDLEEEEEEEPQFTPFVRKIQSQLCGALHQQEIRKKQIKLNQRSNKRLIIFLSMEIEAQKAITKKREEDFELELKEAVSANRVMMDMLEKDALDQEETITEMRLQLGMDPTPNSQRKYFRQRHKRRMQRLSGGLRNLGRRVRQTPKNIRGSKVWKDMMNAPSTPEEEEQQEQVVDELSASERRRGILSRVRRSSRAAADADDPSVAFARQEKKGRFHSSRVEKLSLEDIEDDGRLGPLGRFRRSRQMRQANVHDSELGRYLENRDDSFGGLVDKPKEGGRRPLQGVRRRASNLRKRLVKRQNSSGGKSIDSMDSTLPPTPPNSEKALFPMDDEMFTQEIYALSI